jgi:hypothetical protein
MCESADRQRAQKRRCGALTAPTSPARPGDTAPRYLSGTGAPRGMASTSQAWPRLAKTSPATTLALLTGNTVVLEAACTCTQLAQPLPNALAALAAASALSAPWATPAAAAPGRLVPHRLMRRCLQHALVALPSAHHALPGAALVVCCHHTTTRSLRLPGHVPCARQSWLTMPCAAALSLLEVTAACAPAYSPGCTRTQLRQPLCILLQPVQHLSTAAAAAEQVRESCLTHAAAAFITSVSRPHIYSNMCAALGCLC